MSITSRSLSDKKSRNEEKEQEFAGGTSVVFVPCRTVLSEGLSTFSEAPGYIFILRACSVVTTQYTCFHSPDAIGGADKWMVPGYDTRIFEVLLYAFITEFLLHSDGIKRKPESLVLTSIDLKCPRTQQSYKLSIRGPGCVIC